MRGDILIISANHRKAAAEILDLIRPQIRREQPGFILTIAGESGAGKSEIARALADLLEEEGTPAYILQQDDYFEYPPKTNARMREADIGRVGPGEVRLDLVNSTLASIRSGPDPVEKPLVIFPEDRITSELVSFAPYRVVILEGTYTTLAENVDCRVFIDRNMDDTREDRLKRNREQQNEYLERILRIEHGIISRHRELADIIVNRDFSVTRKV